MKSTVIEDRAKTERQWSWFDVELEVPLRHSSKMPNKLTDIQSCDAEKRCNLELDNCETTA